jgi:glycosyltransferase involved in cell wall biosynthesis
VKVLIVTYVFPPAVAVGMYRILKFCKFLIPLGIQPIVLTPEYPNTMARDNSILSLIPEGVKVIRTDTLEPFRIKKAPEKQEETIKIEIKNEPAPTKPAKTGIFSSVKKRIRQCLSIPDSGYFWIWYGFSPGVNIVKRENIDVILSSSPPHSTHVLASRIARKTGRPHIVDFRDLWTQNTGYEELNLPTFLKRRDRNFELKVLRNARAVTVNTATFRRQLLENNQFLNNEQIEVVTNGVDPEDFRGLLADAKPNDKFTMLYTGSLYGRHRNPEFFFKAIRGWMDNKHGIESQIKIVFIGNWTPDFYDLIDTYKLSEVVERKGWMPQNDALKATFETDLLLLFQGFDPALSAAIPRKLFEYMITNKPIMAFAPPGEIPDIIGEYQCGVCFSDPAPEPIIDFLSKSLDQWKKRDNSKSSPPVLRPMPKLETAAQVGRLATIIKRIA